MHVPEIRIINVSTVAFNLKMHRFGYNSGNVKYFVYKNCGFFSHFVVDILVPRGKSSAIFFKFRDVTLFLSMLYWKDCPVMVTTVVVTTIAVRYKSTADL